MALKLFMKKRIYSFLLLVVISVFASIPVKNRSRHIWYVRRHPSFIVYKPKDSGRKIPLNGRMLMKELRRQHINHANIVLAQAKLESGNFTSYLTRHCNNIFGILHNGKYARYATWQDCVTDYKNSIQKRYHGGNYYTFLKNIGYSENPDYNRLLKNLV